MPTPTPLLRKTIRRWVTWRRARRLCIALVLVVVASSAALRVRSFLLTRKIQAVVSGLQQLRPDVSVEAEARRMVPSMGAGSDVRAEEGIVRHYHLRLSNDDDWYWIVQHAPMYWPVDPFSNEPRTSKWQSLSLPLWTAYVLGWRHIGFDADITVLNGVVSGIRYQIEPDVITGWPAQYMVVVRSVTGYGAASRPRWSVMLTTRLPIIASGKLQAISRRNSGTAVPSDSPTRRRRLRTWYRMPMTSISPASGPFAAAARRVRCCRVCGRIGKP